MGQPAPLSDSQKAQIVRLKHQGLSLPQIAAALPCAYETARKWWRRYRDQGEDGLVGRAIVVPRGVGVRCEAQVVAEAVRLKQTHPRWGPNRVRVALAQRAEWGDVALPSRSQLALIFRDQCPDSLTRYRARATPPVFPPYGLRGA